MPRVDQAPAGPTNSLPYTHEEVFLAAVLTTPDPILDTGNVAHFRTQTRHPVSVLASAEALRGLETGSKHKDLARNSIQAPR